jgi:pyruvate dehydrogenase (NADP+)
MSILENAEKSRKTRFSVGIVDDVSHTSLPEYIGRPLPVKSSNRVTSSVFFAMASDGTVSANKNAVALIGNNTDLYVQGHIWNDSKKAGGVTISHLRFSPDGVINQPYEITSADFVCVSEPTWAKKFPAAIMARIKSGGTLLLNTHCKSTDSLEKFLPREMMADIARKRVELYTIDARLVAKESGLKSSLTNNVIQSAFFKLALGSIFDYESRALPLLEESVRKTYAKKGEAVVLKNLSALRAAPEALVRITVPHSKWMALTESSPDSSTLPETYQNLSLPIGRMEGDNLPVSSLDPYGRFATGMTQFEKRGIATSIPIVDMNKCTQCNLCSLICPHAAIRPFLISPQESESAPFDMKPARGSGEVQGFNFRIQVSPLDCTGCEACSYTCPDDALTMTPVSDVLVEREGVLWEFATTKLPERSGRNATRDNPKSSQFGLPYLEFSGACAGCGETPYAKLITQLFGQRMVIANASGCSGVWGAAAAFSSYTKNSHGEGPAWGRSLYEDAAEYGLGIATALQTRRDVLKQRVDGLIDPSREFVTQLNPELVQLLWQWTNGGKDNPELSQDVSRSVLPMIESELTKLIHTPSPILHDHLLTIQGLYKEFVKTAVFVFGGDGWAYDIGFGGLDHVLASGTDLNIVVFDTEGYANTAGQVSKATNISAVQKFAPTGKRTPKKNLAEMAMTYGYVYVASVAVGAMPQQTVRAFREAEAYPGPSLVLCYSPCIEHKIMFPRGLSRLSDEMVKAVKTGYWPVFRFLPQTEQFILDGPKRITAPVTELTGVEDRFQILHRTHPEDAKSLANELQEWVHKHHASLVQKAKRRGEDMEDGKPIQIIYASETGNAADLAERFRQMCSDRGLRATVTDMSELDSWADIDQTTPLVVMCSTAGDGVIPGSGVEFYESIGKSESSSSGSYTVFALGDSSYTYFNEAGKKFDYALANLGMTRFAPIGLGDDKDMEKYETKFEEWIPSVWKALKVEESLIPAMSREQKFRIKFIPPSPVVASHTPPLVRPLGFELEVVANRHVTPDTEKDRKIVHVTLQEKHAGDLSYHLGDALAVYPRNPHRVVIDLLEHMRIDPNTSLVITACKDKKLASLANLPSRVYDIFSQLLDVSSRPAKSFVDALGELTQRTIIVGDSVAATQNSVKEFDWTANMARLIEITPHVKPRLYSIASSCRAAPAGQVDVLVVQHKWAGTNSGLCSSFIQGLKPGDTVMSAVTAGTFHLPSSHSAPMVMAGVGTGIAPFRAFIQDRLFEKHKGRPFGPVAVFYGCRNEKVDYAFGEEFEELEKQGVVSLLAPAFSRDQKEKIYIQQRIRENASEVYRSLITENGYFYLCGQAGHMADQVGEALTDAFVAGGGISRVEAESLLQELKDNNRISRELY